jgi:hypothetical protein
VPDVMFVRADRLAACTPTDWEQAARLVPIWPSKSSPTDSYVDINKRSPVFARRCQQVWVLTRRRNNSRPCCREKQVTLLKSGDTLTGGDVIEGFSVRVSEVFA